MQLWSSFFWFLCNIEFLLLFSGGIFWGKIKKFFPKKYPRIVGGGRKMKFFFLLPHHPKQLRISENPFVKYHIILASLVLTIIKPSPYSFKMKQFKHISLVSIFLFPIFLFGQNTENALVEKDTALAKALGADEYGMKQYVMAFLKAGPNRNQSQEEAQQLQKAHMDNIQRMADEGSLVVAGPFLDGGDIRGIYIFNVKTIEEAKTLTETDPAIQAGRLVMELHPWYGSAALMKVTEIHQQLPTKEF